MEHETGNMYVITIHPINAISFSPREKPSQLPKPILFKLIFLIEFTTNDQFSQQKLGVILKFHLTQTSLLLHY